MLFQETLSKDRTVAGDLGTSKKRVLEHLSELVQASMPEVTSEEIFVGLFNRERLGSTGLGDGVAIPHCRLAGCKESIGALVKLTSPIDFDAIDGNPVDILFALLVPEDANEEHLQLLASLAEALSQERFRDSLRKAESSEELYNLATNFSNT